jgi:hypothetical protein
MLVVPAVAQTVLLQGRLDPARDVNRPRLFSSFHTPLPEQFIWTHEAVEAHAASNSSAELHYFRVRFDIADAPQKATLYLAGPNSADVYLNGSLRAHVAANRLSRLKIHVFR